MAIIKKLANRLKSLTSRGVIENDLKRLNMIKAGLGDQAVSYVRHGDNETVLSSLSTLGDNGVLNACYNYVPYQDTFSPARCRFIAASTEKSPHLVCRYIEVLNAVTENIPDHAMGSKQVPDKLRIFFTELFNGDVELGPTNSNRKQCHLSLSPEEAFKYCEAFDASAVDFFDVLYQKNNHYYRFDTSQYRQHFALKDTIVANAEAALEAGRRISAQGKKDLIDDIVSWNLVESPEFLQYLLDQAGQSAKEPRKAALNALKQVSPSIIEPLAINKLQKGTVAVRAGMVELLTSLGTESALEAMVSHKANEKTARIIAAIDNAVLAKASNEAVVGSDDANSYVAINNEKIIIPDMQPLATGEYPEFGSEDRQQLRNLFEKENEKIRQQNEEAKKQQFKYKRDLHKLGVIDELLDFFSGKLQVKDTQKRRQIAYLINYGPASAWAKEAFYRLPQDKAVALCVQLGGARGVFHGYSDGVYVGYLRDYLNSDGADFRHLEALEIELKLAYEQGSWGKRIEKQVQPGDLGRTYLAYYYGFEGQADEVLGNSLWPYVASHLDILDEAFGLASKRPDNEYNISRALELLAVLPEAPMRYLGPLLEMAN